MKIYYKTYEKKYPTQEMLNFLYPKLIKMQEDYLRLKGDKPYFQRELMYFLGEEDDFNESDYHPKYKVDLDDLDDLRELFLYKFNRELLEVYEVDMAIVFSNGVEEVLDRFFEPTI